jgi:hypothetical protein
MLQILIPGLVTYFLTKKAKAKGKNEGRAEAKEEYTATINELKKKLQEMQREREKTKNGFQEVIKDVGKIEINDTNFFSKAASLFKGYTNFHLYVITCISYCRYQILKLEIPKQDSDELKTIVLGLVQAGFPDNLKKDIEAVWQNTDLSQVTTTYHKYKGKLNKDLQLSIEDTIFKLNEYLQGYAKLSLQTRELETQITKAS